MKTCEQYVLQKFYEQGFLVEELKKENENLKEKINILENPINEVLEEEKKVDCITLYKSANVIYDLKVNTSLYEYKEAFESVYANGKITLESMKKALEDDEELEKINAKINVSNWSYAKKMYQFEPVTHDMFEFNINDVQYVLWGNYENMSLSRLNNFDDKNGFFYEKFKEQCLEKAREEVREVLKNTIEYLEKKEQENAT